MNFKMWLNEDYDQIVQGLIQNPNDTSYRLIFADFLEEYQGDEDSLVVAAALRQDDKNPYTIDVFDHYPASTQKYYHLHRFGNLNWNKMIAEMKTLNVNIDSEGWFYSDNKTIAVNIKLTVTLNNGRIRGQDSPTWFNQIIQGVK